MRAELKAAAVASAEALDHSIGDEVNDARFKGEPFAQEIGRLQLAQFGDRSRPEVLALMQSYYCKN